MSMQSIRETFFEECEDLLEALAEGLARMESGATDSDCLNAVFRAVHSIKGGAAAFALNDLVAFAHRFETVLDELRSNRVNLTDEVMHLLLRSADHLADLVEAARDGFSISAETTAGFLENLDSCLSDAGFEEPGDDDDFGFTAITLDFSASPLPDVETSESPSKLPADHCGRPHNTAAPHGHRIRFAPFPRLYSNGHDPVALIASLSVGADFTVQPVLSHIPDLASFDPANPLIGWEITTPTSISPETIEAHFDFVRGLCDLEIAKIADPADLAAEAVTIPPTDSLVPPVTPTPDETRPRPSRSEEDPDSRNAKPTLRVDLERVDILINAVGELIINQAMIEQSVLDLAMPGDTDLITHTEDYRLLARDLQEAVMAIRAQPVKPLFQRMSRIVREAAEATGKSARLITMGEATEVDKTVLERLADPLTHMIRNAVDHGLETQAVRAAAGKDPEGTVRLSAAHRSGSVVITISDDGNGLNRHRILEKATSRGLIPEGADLSEAEIDNLLFLPGFSTADKISSLSGRGVGLDVVKNAVTALGGRIAITSTAGSGSDFTISLPLTLAVMDGMVISVAGQTMVVPVASVIETIRPAPCDLHLLGIDDQLLAIRGRFLPTIDLATSLGLHRGEPAPPPLALLVETEAQSHCALIIDAVLDQRQVVIKGLDSNYGAIPGVSAATVLGDGRIALILDTEALTATIPPTSSAGISNQLCPPSGSHRLPRPGPSCDHGSPYVAH